MQVVADAVHAVQDHRLQHVATSSAWSSEHFGKHSSVLIGEPDWRNVGVLNEVGNAIGTYFFETFRLEAMVAAVLAHNAFIIKYLEDREWRLVRTLKAHKRSASGEPLDVLVYEFSRAIWLDRKRRGFFGGPGAGSNA